jgi:hypothetical protein
MAEASDRAYLLGVVAIFLRDALPVRGVQRLAMVGSLTTDKADPKDADVLVTIDDDADLEALAKLGRQLKGAAQKRNRGADIFLASCAGEYLGRICGYRECHPRASCDGRRCNAGNRVCDDFHVVRLGKDLIAKPPLVLWPEVRAYQDLPADTIAIILGKRLDEIAKGAA